MTERSASYPTVSVAMCTYNGARFLDAQLNSILAQTIHPDELVIQDDGSTDATAATIRKFAARAPYPVRLSVNADRLGAARNFGACIGRCTGDIVILTDQDDMWVPDRIARTIGAHRDPALAFTFSDAPLIDEQDRLLGRTIFQTIPVVAADRRRLVTGHDLLPLVLRYGVLYGTTLSFRGDVARMALPLPQGWSHDEWLTHVAAAIGTSRRLEPVTRYRQHAGQVVGAGVAGFQALVTGARHRPGGFYVAERLRYEAALGVLPAEGRLADVLRPPLLAKLAFVTARHQIHRGGLAGWSSLFDQIGRGNYARFAGGLRSIAKDVMIAARETMGRRSS